VGTTAKRGGRGPKRNAELSPISRPR